MAGFDSSSDELDLACSIDDLVSDFEAATGHTVTDITLERDEQGGPDAEVVLD